MAAPILLCDTTGMSNDRWLECRMHGPKGDIPYTIGGSDVAAIFGVSPWTTPLELWMIKKGRMKPKPKNNADQLEMGHLLEPIAAYWYAKKSGNYVYGASKPGLPTIELPYKFERQLRQIANLQAKVRECEDEKKRYEKEIEAHSVRIAEVMKEHEHGILTTTKDKLLKGVGRKIAEKIYDSFGQDTLEILDQEPEKLMTIRGISERRLRMICDSYLATRGARDVIAFLTPHGVTANRAIKIYREYGKDTLDIIRKHPYQLVGMAGIAFKTSGKPAVKRHD